MSRTSSEHIVVGLPLVSIVIINWNYSEYIGRTIDSVKKQDYQNIEVLVVDNSSTDDSLHIIAKSITADKRFRLVRLSNNFGQLGAFFEVYKQLKGEFVINLDADDVLFENFVSTHVQAHLALVNSVALSSSDVTIIGKHDEILRHGYAGRSLRKPDIIGITLSNKIPRIEHFSKEALQGLNDSISLHYGPVGWIWGPGTSNMYRRNVLNIIYERPKTKTWMRSADNFLNPLCHSLVGTALIDQELSAYRVHDKNYYATLRVAGGGRKDKESRQRQLKDFYETTDSLLRRARHYAPLLGDKYWDVVKCVSKFIAPPMGNIMPGSPETFALLERNYALLCEVFTKPVVQKRLPDLFNTGDIYSVVGRSEFIKR
jgi:glycosyltransferase involved in cell wall biosynthesis